MKRSRHGLSLLLALIIPVAAVFLVVSQSALAVTVYAPEYLWEKGIAKKNSPEEILNTFLGIPYRSDGTIDENGDFTTFNRPDRPLDKPGLNCSGLLVSASRFILKHNFTLDEVRRDRLMDSGPDAQMGEDWDFGWDLILNLTESLPRRVLIPGTVSPEIDKYNGESLRGFNLHDENAWRNVLPQMSYGRLYFGTISKWVGRGNKRLLHYHVVLMIPNEKREIWLYHATRRSRVHRINVNSHRGLRKFWAQFAERGTEDKKILIVEALPTDLSRVQNVNDPQSSPSSKNSAKDDTIAVRALEILDNLPAAKTNSKPTMVQADLGNNQSASSNTKTESATKGRGKKAQQAAPLSPSVVIKHEAGKVFSNFPDMVTQVPRFDNDQNNAIQLWYRNRGKSPKNVKILVTSPNGKSSHELNLQGNGGDKKILYPKDFEKKLPESLPLGKYRVDVAVGNKPWLVDIFEVEQLKDAQPKIISIKAPTQVRRGSTFTVEVIAENLGEESDYGGITMSSPNPSDLKLVSAKPGRIYGRGSTVLGITQDRIKLKVPMAEHWIELWAKKKSYNMKVRIKAGSPGVYPLYVRIAVRSVQVKSNVILMDPSSGDTIDQQGFPVYVQQIRVQ